MAMLAKVSPRTARVMLVQWMLAEKSWLFIVVVVVVVVIEVVCM
jgi:hypothetical protein